MTSKALKEVLQRIGTWPESRQEEAARLLLEMEEQDAVPLSLSEAQVEEVRRRLEAPNREFVTLEEAQKRFDSHRS